MFHPRPPCPRTVTPVAAAGGADGQTGRDRGQHRRLSACGSGDIVSALVPLRFIRLATAWATWARAAPACATPSDDGTLNTWADRLANRYGLLLTAQRLAATKVTRPCCGSALPRTLAQQIDAFLASNTWAAPMWC